MTTSSSLFRTRRLWPATLALTLATAGVAAGQADPIARIRAECLERSQVASVLSTLTDVIGPRLTGSPNLRRANEWTRDKLTQWGLKNAALEPWGTFGRGWSLERYSAQIVTPYAFPVVGYPKAWSPGLKRPLRARVVHLDVTDVAGLEQYRGRLKGAIVLASAPRAVQVEFDPIARRRTAEELRTMDSGASPTPRTAPGQRPTTGAGAAGAFRQRLELARRRLSFLIEEKAAAVLELGSQGEAGALFVQAASYPSPASAAAGAPAPRAWDVNAPPTLPQVVLATEDYNRLVRMLRQGETLEMQLELQVGFHTKDLQAYNTVAEIPGTDLKDEVVMLGGHMDSWHSGTGATDNATGVAVCMEAVRVIEALKLRPRRTIRVALWTGEEQGLLGSRAYVARHFRPRTDNGLGAPLPEYDRLAAYFNLDVGTGKARGIYINGQEAVRGLFQEWLKPFHDLGATAVSSAGQRGTDHNSFEEVGLPGYQFIQDPIEYFNRTHHSNLDVYDRAIVEDLKVSSAIMAAFVYNAAMLDRPLARRAVAAATPRPAP